MLKKEVKHLISNLEIDCESKGGQIYFNDCIFYSKLSYLCVVIDKVGD